MNTTLTTDSTKEQTQEQTQGDWHVQTATAEDAGTRLDKWLAGWTGLSRTRLRVLIETGQVRVGGDIVTSPTAKIKEDIEYALLVPPPWTIRQHQKISRSTLYIKMMTSSL